MSPSWPTPAAAARAPSSRQGLTALHNLDHRGAAGSEPNSGDGAGILTQVPDALLRAEVDFDLPPMGEYAVGIAFLPADEAERAARVDDVARLADEEGLTVLGWRDVPVDPDGADLGPTARAVMPHFAQLFVAETMGARADATAFGGTVAPQRGDPPRAARLRAAQAGRARRRRRRQLAVHRVAVRRGRSPTRAC